MMLTPELYQTFEKHLRKWQVRLNLQSWRIAISKQQVKSVMAITDKFDYDQHTCRIRLGQKWPEEWSDHDVETLAVHELLHVLFCDMLTEASEPGHDPDKVASLEHHVINILEPILVPKRGKDD